MITPSTIVTRNCLRAANAVRAGERKRRAMRKIAIMGVAAAIAAGATRAAETLTWTGAESSVWDLTAVNWKNASGVPTAWVDGSDALFTADAASPVSVAGDVKLRNMTLLAPAGKEMGWSDGGGSLTFVSDAANPTNYITLDNDGRHCTLSARVVCAAPLVKASMGVLLLANRDNDLSGGLVVTRNQLRFMYPGSIGPGPLTLATPVSGEGQTTAFLEGSAASCAPDVKFVQGNDSYIGSIGSNVLTVRSVGTEDNASRFFGFGRTGTGLSCVTLSLTDPDSEGIGLYRLRGDLRLTLDGGTVKSAPENAGLLFKASASTTPEARVTPNGVTFDTAGTSADLGLTLKFDRDRVATNVLETVYPGNWSFETGSFSSWSVAKNDTPATAEGSQVQVNDGAFMKVGDVLQPDYFTTNGTRFAVIRRYHSMSQTVNLPSAGRWRVVYERGCRPDPGYPSQGLDLTVTLGGAENATVSPAQSAAYPFRREETVLFDLAAGPAPLTFAVGPSARQNVGVFLDAIRLERCETVPLPTGPLVKTGEGLLAVTNLVKDGLVAVSNGTLAVKESVLDGAAVEVAGGATLELYATKITNATVNVAAGGTLALRDGDGRNLIVNGSFEENAAAIPDDVEFRSYSVDAGPTGWTFDFDPTPIDGNNPSPGIQLNGGSMSSTYGAFTPHGRTTAYMRSNTTISQKVNVPADGTYELSFLQGCRNNYLSYNIPLSLLVDGTVVLSNDARTAYYDFFRNTVRLELTAGEHTVTIATGYTSHLFRMLFVDDVRLVPTEGTNALDGNALAFASGATLDLRNAEPFYVAGGVTVDGHEVKGSANALRRAGVIVTGDGEIQIGPPQGTMLLVR